MAYSTDEDQRNISKREANNMTTLDTIEAMAMASSDNHHKTEILSVSESFEQVQDLSSPDCSYETSLASYRVRRDSKEQVKLSLPLPGEQLSLNVILGNEDNFQVEKKALKIVNRRLRNRTDI